MSDEEFVWVRMPREIAVAKRKATGSSYRRVEFTKALDREPSVLLPEAPVRAWYEQAKPFFVEGPAKGLVDAIDAALPAPPPEPWAVGDAVTKPTNPPMTGEVVWVGRRGLTILWPDQPVPMTYSVGNSYLETFRRPDALDQPVPLPEETT